MSISQRPLELYRNGGITEVFAGVYRFIYYNIIRPVSNLSGDLYGCLRYFQFRAALAILIEAIYGKEAYQRSLIQDLDRYHLIETNGYKMYVDTEDPGLSAELLSYGVRELRSTIRFKAELRELAERIDGEITILELGMNIGYYGLLEAQVLGSDADIHAFEVSPSNADLASRNIDLNGFEDRVTIHQCAVGADSGSVQVELTERSNRNRINSGFRDVIPEEVVDEIETEKISVDEYLENEQIDPTDVNVVRMDVQGYEWKVLQGMTSVLDADSPLLLFIETHPSFIDREKQQVVIDHLKRGNLDLVHTSNNFRKVRADTIDDLLGTSAEAILRR